MQVSFMGIITDLYFALVKSLFEARSKFWAFNYKLL